MLILRNIHCLLEPIDNMPDGIGVLAIGRPNFFPEDTPFLDQCRVQSIRRGCVGFRLSCLHLSIEGLCFCLGYITVVEMAGRCLYQVFSVSLVHPLRKHGFIEDNRKHLVAELTKRLPFTQWKPTHVDLLQLFPEIIG